MKSQTIAAIAAVFLMASSIASAHVVVEPREAPAGDTTTYTVRIPSHLEATTTAIELEVPPRVEIVTVEKTALGHELMQAKDGPLVIRWMLNIPADERGEVKFVARNPKQAGEVAWKARQIYSNGVTVEWTEPKGGKQPAAVTRIVEAGSK